jgi:hypothetical protein
LFTNDDLEKNDANNLRKRLELLKTMIDNQDEYHLIKVLVSHLLQNYSLDSRIPLLKNESNWKNVLTKYFKCVFRNTDTDEISKIDDREYWIYLLASTDLLNNSRNDGKILGKYGDRIVLYATSGHTWNAYGNVILDKYHHLPCLAQLIKNKIITGPMPIDGTVIFSGWNIGFMYNGVEYCINIDGHLMKKREGYNWETLQNNNSDIIIDNCTNSESLLQFLKLTQ